MVITKKMCAIHRDRQAIGVCVMTQKPICAECSTRYEGVNYSREGLRLLKAQRATAQRHAAKGHRTVAVLSIVASPLLLGAIYVFYRLAMVSLIQLQQLSFEP